MEIIEEKTMNGWKEEPSDKNYNRYIQASITGIDQSVIRKIIHFQDEGIYLIYLEETIEESLMKWKMRMLSKQKNS